MEVTIENYNPWKGSFFGGIVLVLVGVLFLALGNDALKWVMIIAGVLVLISGLIALVDAAKAHGGTMSLLAGGIQVIIGVVLIVAASLWVDLLMIILGAVLLVIGLVSLVQLKSGPSTTSSKVVTIIIAVILIVLGVLAILNPESAADIIMYVIGAFLLISGLLQMYEAYKIKSC